MTFTHTQTNKKTNKDTPNSLFTDGALHVAPAGRDVLDVKIDQFLPFLQLQPLFFHLHNSHPLHLHLHPGLKVPVH